ncbi:MAG: S41 family peptidase [bacterium]
MLRSVPLICRRAHATAAALTGLLLAGCPPPQCPRNPSGQFEDPEIKRLSPAQRDADLAALGALLRDSYPHLQEKQRRFGVNVSAALSEQREVLLQAVNRYQYMNAVDRILLSFHDGHLTSRGYARTFARTYRSALRRSQKGARPRPPAVLVGVGLTLRYVAGQVAVVRVRPGSPAERAGVRPGDVLLLVSDQPALSRMGSSLRWRSWARLAAGLQAAASRVMINRPWYPDTPLPRERLLILRSGRRLRMTLVGARTPEVETLKFGLRRLACPAGAQDAVAVLRLGTFGGARRRLWKRITELLAEARTARALVIDLRGNRGGSQGLARMLVARLISRPVVAGEYRYLRTPVLMKKVPVIPTLRPDPADPRWTVWKKDIINPVKQPLALPAAALVDELCASSCETVARALSAAPGIKLYGRPTAGSSGLPVRVTLPHSRLIISVPSWQSRTAGGLPVEGSGVVPQVRVPLRLEALRAGVDAPLAQAVRDLCKGLATAARGLPRPRPAGKRAAQEIP